MSETGCRQHVVRCIANVSRDCNGGGERPWGGTAAWAQSQEGLEDIVVTAQQRSENLQRTPLSISAISAMDLERKGAVDTVSIAQTTPSVYSRPYSGSASTVAMLIRGQGLLDPMQITRDGAVGVYIARPQTGTLDLADVERVEVLRGPQGTLYGRNTTGGAINKRYATHVIANGDAINGYTSQTYALGEPAVYGVQLGFDL
jgi:outer membrane receptor protein involved in Fe transport